MWFIVIVGRLKSFLASSKADKSLTAFLVLLKELLKGQKEANLYFAPLSYLRVDLTGAEFIQDYFVELEQIFCLQPSRNIIEG